MFGLFDERKLFIMLKMLNDKKINIFLVFVIIFYSNSCVSRQIKVEKSKKNNVLVNHDLDDDFIEKYNESKLIVDFLVKIERNYYKSIDIKKLLLDGYKKFIENHSVNLVANVDAYTITLSNDLGLTVSNLDHPVETLFVKKAIIKINDRINKEIYPNKLKPYMIMNNILACLDGTSRILRINKNLGGIGIELRKNVSGNLEIVNVINNSPAFYSELKKMDLIVEIDNNKVSNYKPEEAIVLLQGSLGTKVTIKVLQDGKLKEIQLIRRRIETNYKNRLKYTKIQNINYFKISSFALSTSTEFEENITNIAPNEPIIIDIRNNAGGVIPSINKILDFFLPDNLYLYSFKYNNRKNDVNTHNPLQLQNPIVLLVNQSTDSGSVLFVSMLKKYLKDTVVVGQKTKGLGFFYTIQHGYEDIYFRLTSGQFTDEKSLVINQNGVIPDVAVDNKDNKNDLQLQAAIDMARKFIK